MSYKIYKGGCRLSFVGGCASEEFDHSGDTCFTVVVVTNIPCCPFVEYLYLVFVRLRVGSHMAAAYSNWGLTKVLILSLPILRFLRRKPKDTFAFL